MNKKDQITIITTLTLFTIVMSYTGFKVLTAQVDGLHFYPTVFRVGFSLGVIFLYSLLGKEFLKYWKKKREK